GRPEDVLQGFAAGADDYLPKPFDLSILIARLNGLLRRMSWHTADGRTNTTDDLTQFEFAGRKIDFENLRLEALGKQIHLTLMEADLLRYLVRNPGRAISRRELLEQVWRLREDTDTRAIDNFIVRLRRYIEDEPSSPRYLRTVRGIGYSFVPEGE
ncbi:MAG: winged helix-turn-helix domain-containing protein, partial [Acidobacteriaceae bacterium]